MFENAPAVSADGKREESFEAGNVHARQIPAHLLKVEVRHAAEQFPDGVDNVAPAKRRLFVARELDGCRTGRPDGIRRR